MQHLRLALGAVLTLVAALSVAAAAPADPSPPVVYALPFMDSLDPAITYTQPTWQVEYATCANLVTYADDPGAPGTVLVPDAASALPTVSSDGLTYTFTIRSGLGFSPPSTEQVTPAAFVRAIERLAKAPDPRWGAGFSTNIAGFAEYAAGTQSTISGLSVSGNQLTVRLVERDGSALSKLAMPFFCAVPANTPDPSSNTTAIPSAGPYCIDPSSVTESGGTVTGFHMLRNPNYTGSRPHVLNEIDFTVISNPQTAVGNAQASPPTVDVVPAVGVADRPALRTSHGPGSAAANAGHQQYYDASTSGTYFLVFNTPRITDVRIRKAIATAMDRTALASDFGLTPTDQYVAPSMPGFVDKNLFSLTSDASAAQALMQQAGYGPSNHLALTIMARAGTNPYATASNRLASELSSIYIDATVDASRNPSQYFTDLRAMPDAWDLAIVGWIADYADPYDMVDPLLDSRLATTDPANDANFSRWASTAANEGFDYNNSLLGSARTDALEQQADSIAANDVPLAAFGTTVTGEFFSTRVGCIVSHVVYGLDLARLCDANAVAANDTYAESGTVSSSDPVQAAVTTPNAGNVSVVQVTQTDTVPGYQIVGQQLVIEAPAASASAPLQLSFTVDAATLAAAGLTKDTVQVVRNGVVAGECPGSSTASPDPCVSSRTADTQGNAVLTVLTSHASTWTFATADTTPPTLDTVTLGSATITPGSTTTLAATALSGAVAAEFYVDNDAGAGSNTFMSGDAGSFFTPPFGTSLAAGTHTLGVRVRDAALNWSAVKTVILTVAVASSGASGSGSGGSSTPATPPATTPPATTPPVSTPPTATPLVVATGINPRVKAGKKAIVVYVATGRAGVATLFLTTKAGKRLVRANTTLSAVTSVVTLKLPRHLKPGTYLVKVYLRSGAQTAQKTLTFKLVK